MSSLAIHRKQLTAEAIHQKQFTIHSLLFPVKSLCCGTEHQQRKTPTYYLENIYRKTRTGTQGILL
jgi:hypothetical protein